MLTYSFTDIGAESLYQHLYKCIKSDILSGKLSVGTKLPSKRSFAKNLGISTITVENAYAQLLAEGYISSLPKKGYFVNQAARQWVSAPSASPCCAEPLPQPTPYLADFVTSQTNPDNFPFSTWAKLMREIIAQRSTDLMRNPPGAGISELRTAICNHLRQFRNMDIAPGQVVIGAGTEYLYGLLIQLLGYDKVYAVENPGYRKASQIFRSNHVECRYAAMDHDGIHVDSLEEIGADIVHLSPAHHYPTGIITPIGRRYELLDWASASASRYIIEDDYDSEFRLTGRPIPMLQSIDCMEKVIYMNTFSKSLASTIRVSYMILPRHLMDRYVSDFSFYACTVSNFEQYTLARFLQEGYFEKHINRMRTYYKGLRDALVDAIKKSPLSSRVRITEENSGLHFLMQVDTKMSDEEIVRAAADRGIRIACLSQYYMDGSSAQEHVLVMNYSGLRTDNLAEAVNTLADCFR